VTYLTGGDEAKTSIQPSDFQRGFTEALRWSRSKMQEAISILSEAIGNLEDQQFTNVDEALMILRKRR
jgi:hypothetical protein